ncbi:hypothetical protein ACFVJR_04140 [Nocardia salmonicida]|uniref:hypothetical protein n=1 Tax=Nocardia salmonicida TaxID=53431 RepID=UPI00363D257B
MTPTPPPEWTAATLATVRRQPLDARLQRQFRVAVTVAVAVAVDWRSQPQSPIGRQDYQQDAR